MKKVLNQSKYILQHADVRLERGVCADIPDNIAKIWGDFDGVSVLADVPEVKAEVEVEAKAEPKVEVKPKKSCKK